MKKFLTTLLSVGICCLMMLSSGQVFAKEAPAFSLPNLEGEEVTLESFRGKIIVLDFWATWCPPCREEIPSFIKLYTDFKDKGVEIIGISLDKSVGDVKSFVKRGKINYPILMGNSDVTESYGGIQSIPTTIIIDRDLNIISQHVGFTESSVFTKEIEKALMQKNE